MFTRANDTLPDIVGELWSCSSPPERGPFRMLSCAHCLPKILLFLGVTVTALMSATQDEATLIREMPAEQWRASGGAVGRPDAQGIFSEPQGRRVRRR